MQGEFLVAIDGELTGTRPLLATLEHEELQFRLLTTEHREPHAWLVFDAGDGTRAVERTRRLRCGRFVGAIVVLTGPVALPMVRAGYRGGVDDWAIAPFSGESIGARLRWTLERKFPAATDEVLVQCSSSCEPVVIDGHSAVLTETEFKVFHYLLESRDRTIRERELMREALGTHHQDDSSVIRFHIQNIRAKFWYELIWSDHGYNLSLSRSELDRRSAVRLAKAGRGSGKVRRVS